MSGSGRNLSRPKCFLLFGIMFGLNIKSSWSSCLPPQPIKNGTIQLLSQSLRPDSKTGKYPEHTEAKVECHSGSRLSYSEYQYLICTNGEWKHHQVIPDGAICVPIQCGRPPVIEHGHYTSEMTRFKSGDRAGETYPLGTTLVPACEPYYFTNCTTICGRISCGPDGSWLPKDGKVIKQCFLQPEPLNRTNLSKPIEDRGTGSETSLKHYLIIILAVICIMIVGALTVLLLRRPTFCKKHSGRSSRDNRGSGGANFNPNLLRSGEDNSGMMTSSTPMPPPLDSLPVAMNTGIFVPGGSYDWQECRFQEATLTGTSVFK